MKLSNVVAQFLVEQGIGHAFVVSGGASLHLIHSIAETKGTAYVCPQHEQAGAMAADAYARVTGGMGCAVATSGPGATNLITGICSAYYDSVPVLFLTGNVATFRAKGDTGVRQVGFQETEMAEMCRSITKYSVLIKDPYRIRYELQKAVAIAKAGRPGPVLVDIPDDLQRMDIDPSKLVGYTPEPDKAKEVSADTVAACLDALRNARRPVLVFGWGIHLSHAEAEARELAKRSAPGGAHLGGARPLPVQRSASVGGLARTASAPRTSPCRTPTSCCRSAHASTPRRRSPASSFAREARSSWSTSMRRRSASSSASAGIDLGISTARVPASADQGGEGCEIPRPQAVARARRAVEGTLSGRRPEIRRATRRQSVLVRETARGAARRRRSHRLGHRLRARLDDAGLRIQGAPALFPRLQQHADGLRLAGRNRRLFRAPGQAHHPRHR
jgi:hypothetical protein